MTNGEGDDGDLVMYMPGERGDGDNLFGIYGEAFEQRKS